jgi:hypothetical protein
MKAMSDPFARITVCSECLQGFPCGRCVRSPEACNGLGECSACDGTGRAQEPNQWRGRDELDHEEWQDKRRADPLLG